MSREFFATKLAAGRAASTKAGWWPRHLAEIERYVDAAIGHDLPAVALAREALVSGAPRWEGIARHGTRPGLMARHILLEAALAEAAAAGDAKAIGKMGGLLFENAEEQAQVGGLRIEDFPQVRFLDMVSRHVSSLAEGVRLRMEGRGLELASARERGRENVLALAAFTAEWF